MTLSNKMIDILIKKIIRIETRKYVKRGNHYDYIYDFYWYLSETITPMEYYFLLNHNIIEFESPERKIEAHETCIQHIKQGIHYMYKYGNIKQNYKPDILYKLKS